jgi:hypothetical protein
MKDILTRPVMGATDRCRLRQLQLHEVRHFATPCSRQDNRALTRAEGSATGEAGREQPMAVIT